MPSGSRTPRRLLVRQAVSVVAATLLVVYLILVPLGFVEQDHRLSTPEIVLAVAIIVLSQYSIEDLTVDASGASRIRLRRIESRQRAIESDIKVMQVALSGIVTKHELRHLRGLDSDGPFDVQYSNHMVRELERLDAMRFVVPVQKAGINAIRRDHEAPDDRFNLQDYVRITNRGREYLKLLDAVAAQGDQTWLDDIAPQEGEPSRPAV
ncbi:hypothetical protein ACFFMN_02655 [Planobispora siamensis]|uniref:Uncharacterized protein n=1 Tax=Planobispora siamensis TaxID=936338 RepID=A0A8J3SEA0_9ACTN|nr:hypothetical protein [Planobispora siamensis]GIH93056.1 hypothetical protein Psi01_36860 [Planobispora siamensis]